MTAFDFQILCLGAQRVIDKVFSNTTEVSHLPDHAVVICDDREYLKGIVEGLLYGNHMDTGEKWRFYRANELDLPSFAEMKNLYILIIWASTSSPSLKENEDGSYPSWVKPVIKLIKNAFTNFPNLKILGIQLGSHLISIALGGRVDKMQLDEA